MFKLYPFLTLIAPSNVEIPVTNKLVAETAPPTTDEETPLTLA